MLFCNYLTYSELWGPPKRGMTNLEVEEVHLAFEEWDRHRKARERWEEDHKGAEAAPFDVDQYIDERVYCIENDLDELPIDE